jgi:hypothetical protein
LPNTANNLTYRLPGSGKNSDSLKYLAKTISIIFHPLTVPTLGFFFLFYSDFYFSLLDWEIKRFVLIALFFTTCVLPAMILTVLALNPNFSFKMDKPTDRIVPLLFSAFLYYLGFYLLRNLNILPVFKVFMVASSLVITALLLISIKWKISIHMTAIGGITGVFLAVSYRTGTNPLILLSASFLIAGVVGSTRIYLEKHNFPQVIAGYLLGSVVLFLAVFFI